MAAWRGAGVKCEPREATKRPRAAAFGAPPVPDFAAIEVNSVATAALGDFDRSGAVEARDLTRLLSAWGTGGPLADLDGDGIVAIEVLSLIHI